MKMFSTVQETEKKGNKNRYQEEIYEKQLFLK